MVASSQIPPDICCPLGTPTQVLLYNSSILPSVSRMWWHHNRVLRISAVSWVPQHRSYCIIHLFFNLFLGCGGIITDSSGYLLSPGYPNQYSNNLRCNYTLKMDPQHYIVLEFDPQNFEIEGKFILLLAVELVR